MWCGPATRRGRTTQLWTFDPAPGSGEQAPPHIHHGSDEATQRLHGSGAPAAYGDSAGTWPALALRITCLRNSSAAGSRRRSADQVRHSSRTAPGSVIPQ